MISKTNRNRNSHRFRINKIIMSNNSKLLIISIQKMPILYSNNSSNNNNNNSFQIKANPYKNKVKIKNQILMLMLQILIIKSSLLFKEIQGL